MITCDDCLHWESVVAYAVPEVCVLGSVSRRMNSGSFVNGDLAVWHLDVFYWGEGGGVVLQGLYCRGTDLLRGCCGVCTLVPYP